MGVLFDRRRIDPADVTIRAAVNQIDAAMSSVPEHDDRHARHVELHHRVAHGKPLQGGGRFGDDDRAPLRHLLLAVLRGRGDDIARRVDRGTVGRLVVQHFAIGPHRLTVFEPSLVTAQALFQAHGRLIGAGIGVGGKRIGFEHNAGIEMDHALRAETKSFLADGHVTGKPAVEILCSGFRDALIDASAQCLADVDVLARDAKRHDRFPMIPLFERQEAAPSDVCFSRRRCTDEAIRIASRYFATVRRAMSMPATRSFSTMVSSDSTCSGLSASISCLIRWRTASAEWASPPSAAAIAEVKKYFSSKMPRLVAMYLLAVTRETVDSCMSMASAMVLRLSGRKCRTP